MEAQVCQVCKSKYYEDENENLGLLDVCKSCNLNEKEEQKRAFRTSTPIPELDSASSSFSDSVLDFFYQIWKSELLSESSRARQKESNGIINQQLTAQQPFSYASSQIVYVSTVVFQSSLPVFGLYLQPVGYRPDGTFGVLPFYWPSIV